MELLKPTLSALQPSNQRTVCVIADVDAIKDDPARRAVYDWLHPQGIHSLIAVPVYHGSELHGFLCAENLRQNIDAPELMEKIAYMAAGGHNTPSDAGTASEGVLWPPDHVL